MLIDRGHLGSGLRVSTGPTSLEAFDDGSSAAFVAQLMSTSVDMMIGVIVGFIKYP